MKTEEEMIEVMQHFAKGGDVEMKMKNNIGIRLVSDEYVHEWFTVNIYDSDFPMLWNWEKYDIRIKENET